MIDDFEAAWALLFTYEERTSTGLRPKTAPGAASRLLTECPIFDRSARLAYKAKLFETN